MVDNNALTQLACNQTHIFVYLYLKKKQAHESKGPMHAIYGWIGCSTSLNQFLNFCSSASASSGSCKL